MYLDPGLAGHVPFLHLVSGQRAASVVLWSVPRQVDMLPSHLHNLEVLGSTGRRWRTQTPQYRTFGGVLEEETDLFRNHIFVPYR